MDEKIKCDYVSVGVYKQVTWERDIAIEQLHELGYEFGEKIEPTFKVYQIRRCSGEWEDYHERVVGCFMSEKKAIAEKERLEVEEAEKGNCNECPLYFCEHDCNHDCKSCAEDNYLVEKQKNFAKDMNRLKVLNEIVEIKNLFMTKLGIELMK